MRLPPWMWRIIRSRRTKVALACSPFALLVAIAAFYLITGWWGRHQVKRYVRDLEGAGYAVDPEKYWTPADNPNDDVLQHPVMRQEMEQRVVARVRERDPAIPGLAKRTPPRAPAFAQAMDLALWFDPPETDEKVAAERLLREQREVVERLEALLPALARREAVWRAKTSRDEFFGTGAKITSIAEEVMRLQRMAGVLVEVSTFHLAAGDVDAAAAHVEAMLDIARLKLEPKPAVLTMITAQVVSALIQNAVWEGIARRCWDDVHLQSFDAKLAALDPQQAAIRSHPGEIALARSAAESLMELVPGSFPRMDRIDWKDGWDWEPAVIREKLIEIAGGFRPPGFILTDQLRAHKMLREHGIHSNGSPRLRFTGRDLSGFRERSDKSPFYVNEWDALKILAYSALRAETAIALTRAGIALERYRMVHGNHPAALDELVPQFLPDIPVDPFDDKSLRYRLQADGSPHVWSVGGNLIDDGGLPSHDSNRGDLIWITKPIPGFTERDFRRF